MIWGEPILGFVLGWLVVGFAARVGWKAADRSFDAIADWVSDAYWWAVDKIRGLRS